MIDRGRPEESGVTIEYLTSLHSKLEEWSTKCEHVVDATRDKKVVLDDVISIAFDALYGEIKYTKCVPVDN